MSDKWLLEYNSDNEIYTEAHASEELIERDLNFFDGKRTFYCALSDTTDESTLWCIGEPNRRILEVSLREEEYVNSCLVQGPSQGTAMLRTGLGNDDGATIEVPIDEVFTKQQALEVFLFFYHNGKIPPKYSRRQKSYISR